MTKRSRLPNVAKLNILYTGFDGGGGAKVVTQTAATAVYTLRQGQRPKRLALNFLGHGTVDRFVSDGSDRFFAADSLRVTRLNGDFAVDRTFGLRGVATATHPVNGLFADPYGRVLVTDGDLLKRLI